jgi:hypothetical membrane protein
VTIAKTLRRSTAQPSTRPTPPTRGAVVCAAVLPVWLTGSWLLADAAQPPGFSAVRQTVSVTAGYGGTDRWIMTSALVVTAALYLVIVAGAPTITPAGRVALAVCGLAAAGIAAFPQPPHGSTAQHLTCTAIGALALVAVPLLCARRRPAHWAESYAVALPVTAVFVGLFLWMVSEVIAGGLVGLAERIGPSIETCWPFVVVGTAARRTTHERSAGHVTFSLRGQG